MLHPATSLKFSFSSAHAGGPDHQPPFGDLPAHAVRSSSAGVDGAKLGTLGKEALADITWFRSLGFGIDLWITVPEVCVGAKQREPADRS